MRTLKLISKVSLCLLMLAVILFLVYAALRGLP